MNMERFCGSRFAEELGIEIEIDESVVVEERPSRKKKEEAPAAEEAAE